jgi:starvation-inducible outer membrane lipoprotein
LAWALVLALFLAGCYTHISKVEDKWGPPAKIEHRKDTIVYYYYFYKGEERLGGDVVAGYVVVEITTNLEGKILKKRKYWKQPQVK